MKSCAQSSGPIGTAVPTPPSHFVFCRITRYAGGRSGFGLARSSEPVSGGGSIGPSVRRRQHDARHALLTTKGRGRDARDRPRFAFLPFGQALRGPDMRAAWGLMPQTRECPERLEAFWGQPTVRCDECCKIREDGQLPRDVRGSSGPPLGVPGVGV